MNQNLGNSHDLRLLTELERKVLWLASWTIHQANHVRRGINFWQARVMRLQGVLKRDRLFRFAARANSNCLHW